jgi:regulator of sigma E protease
MDTIIASLHSLYANIAPFFILLGILIFVHEMGHFLVAKYFGVRVEVFSLGFGRKILKWQRGDTTYCLSAIPLGGYVKMYGDDLNAKIPEDQKAFAFLHKPVMQRFAVVLAGPMMNLFFAIFIFSFIVALGEDVPGPYIGDVTVDSAAYKDGFRSGDKIVQVNGEDTPTWMEVQKKVEAAGGTALPMSVEHLGQSTPTALQVPVVYGENDNIFSHDRQVGQVPGLSQESRSTVTGVKDPESPAGKAGIQTLHQIVSVNGQKVSYWRELQPVLEKSLKPGDTALQVEVREIDKPETQRKLQVALPADWQAHTSDLTELIGVEPAELYIYQIKKGTPADRIGMQAKDKIVRIGQDPIHAWSDVLERVKSFKPDGPALDFVVMRDGKELTFKVKPEMTSVMTAKGQEEHRYTIGILSGFFPIGAEPVFYQLRNPVKIVAHGLQETYYWTEFVVMSLVRLVEGQVSAKNIGGVITIGRVASHSFAAGLSTFMRMMGLISINLFLLNLLPIPILDGGHLLFYAIEVLRGSPLSIRKMEIAQQVGLMLLMFLMAFAFFNDISNLISGPW